MQVTCRKIKEADLDRLCEMEERSFSMPWKREDFEDLLLHEESQYVVLLLDDFVIGAAGFTFNGYEGYINNVVIDEEYRGKGYSKLLMEGLLNLGRKAGIDEFTLEVRVSNTPAVKLYESLGFVSEGVRKNFYERPTEDAYVMWLRY